MMKKLIAFLLSLVMISAVCTAYAEEDWEEETDPEDFLIVELVEGQTVLFEGIITFDTWDTEYIDVQRMDGYNQIHGIKPGYAAMTSRNYDCTVYTKVLPKTETPAWLLGAWQGKMKGGTFNGYTVTYVFHEDGTAFSNISKPRHIMPVFAEYSCGGDLVRLTKGRYPTVDLVNETLAPRISEYSEERITGLKHLNDKNTKKAKKIKTYLYRNSPRDNTEETIPAGSPDRKLVLDVEPDNAADLSARFVSSDPSVADVRWNAEGEPVLYTLQPGTAEIQAISYSDENVVSNTITVTVTESETSVPEDILGYAWKFEGFYSSPVYYVFLPDGTMCWYSIEGDSITVDKFEYRVHDDYIVTGELSAWEKYIWEEDGEKTVASSCFESIIPCIRSELTTGWQTIGNYKAWFDENGIPATGWFQVDGKTYYAENNCRVVTGEYQINYETYVFDSTGVLQSPLENK